MKAKSGKGREWKWPFLTDWEWKVVAITIGSIIAVEKAEQLLIYTGHLSGPVVLCAEHVPISPALHQQEQSLEDAAASPASHYATGAANLHVDINQKPWSKLTLGDVAWTVSEHVQSRLLSGDSGSHPHEALYFLVIAILVGTFIVYLLTLKIFKGVQQTVVLFVFGLVLSLINEAVDFESSFGAIGRSYGMWMRIDPHLLLFTMLPPLLAGDAMTIDTSVAKRVAKACLYLAGPGVVVQAFTAALFLYFYLPFNWDFLLCLTTGSILCATDPVAVIALLKELGAPAILTVTIQGESLLNDGTAIVLFLIAYNMLAGEEYGISDIIMFLIKTAIYAWGCGMTTGFFFFQWIRLANDKLNHSSSLIQVSCTILSCYSSFLIAEGVFGMSGVLSTVAASLTLAHFMWQEVVEHETMHTIWHMLEYLGNTVIFFLAGALVGRVLPARPAEDYFHLLVIYVILVAIRGSFTFGSRPILKLMDCEVSFADALVMTWGGLRGAVGLALAIQVAMDKAGGKISAEDGERVLFFVGGVVLCTLVINAQTCPHLVQSLGVAKMASSRRRLLQIMYRQMTDMWFRVSEGKVSDEVNHKAEHMLDEVEKSLEGGDDDAGQQPNGIPDVSPPVGPQNVDTAASKKSGLKLTRGATRDMKLNKIDVVADCTKQILCDIRNYQDVVRELKPELRKNVKELQFVSKLESKEFDAETENLIQVLEQNPVETALLRTLVEAFMSLMKIQYHHQIQSHGAVSNSIEGDTLLSSISCSLEKNPYELGDFDYVVPSINLDNNGENLEDLDKLEGVQATNSERAMGPSKTETKKVDSRKRDNCCRRVVESIAFDAGIMFVIFINTMIIVYEDLYNVNDNPAGFVLEVLFTLIYLAEFVLKYGYQYFFDYFFDPWNILDFSLLIAGIVGLVFMMMSLQDTTSDIASTARINRVLKTVRLVRLIRTLRLAKILYAGMTNKAVDLAVATKMQHTNMLQCFMVAHIEAQKDFKKFVCHRQNKDSAEVARVLLQSTVSVYKALILCAYERKSLDADLVCKMNTYKDSLHIAEDLVDYVMQTNCQGIINNSEAHQLLHPLHDEMKEMTRKLESVRLGINPEPQPEPEAHGDHADDHEKASEERGQSGEHVALIAALEPASEPSPAASANSQVRKDSARWPASEQEAKEYDSVIVDSKKLSAIAES